MSLQYYTPKEVAQHNGASDCWVSFLGSVYDLTSDDDVMTIIDNAGRDISHWFDAETHDLRKHVDKDTGISCYYTPQGTVADAPPLLPSSNYRTTGDEPWWKRTSLCIGRVTRNVARVKIYNVLTQQEHTVEVCLEETLEQIKQRYSRYNSHSGSYKWKYLGRDLDNSKTLVDNGVVHDQRDFDECDIDPDEYMPCMHIFFTDDLTVN